LRLVLGELGLGVPPLRLEPEGDHLICHLASGLPHPLKRPRALDRGFQVLHRLSQHGQPIVLQLRRAAQMQRHMVPGGDRVAFVPARRDVPVRTLEDRKQRAPERARDRVGSRDVSQDREPF
jgi:hypothetical protein